jgi:hypothetical protein
LSLSRVFVSALHSCQGLSVCTAFNGTLAPTEWTVQTVLYLSHPEIKTFSSLHHGVEVVLFREAHWHTRKKVNRKTVIYRTSMVSAAAFFSALDYSDDGLS